MKATFGDRGVASERLTLGLVTKRTRKRKPIYIESLVKGSVDRIWELTQEPAQHQRWDVRFGEISYMPAVEGEPQQFVYATEPIPGLRVDGRGESIGDRDRPDGSRYSGLKFWSDHPLSIVKEGAGYWRYIPTDDGVRFLTRFDYRPRWGKFGEVVDRVFFRPLFGWATAWSFDRLRMWVEDDIEPEKSRNRALIKTVAASSLALAVLRADRQSFVRPSSPVSLNGLMMALATILIVAQRQETPSAFSPLREPPPRDDAAPLSDDEEMALDQ